MGSKLKSSGIFFGCLFSAALILNIGSLAIDDGLSILSIFSDFRSVLSLLLLSAILFATAFIEPLAWLQPVIFLILVPVPLMNSTDSFFGLGFFAVAVLLLFKLGFYDRHRIAKATASVVYILAVEVIVALIHGEQIYMGLMPAIFIVGFLFFLFITFRDKLFIYLKEPKPKLSLSEKGLSDAEQLYIAAIAMGKSSKEISIEAGVSESTVRNTLSRAYKKFDVSSRGAFLAMVSDFEIID
jgi:DNA-binding CsgD family transcriptional regulator